MKKFLSLFLVFSLVILSVNLYAKERRGVKLVITTLDGQLIEGELITVKPKSLLLLDTEGKDVSVGIADIRVIRIVKKSKLLLGAGIGLVIGGGGVYLLGQTEDAGYEYIRVNISLFAAAIGTFVGGIIGALLGKDETIQIEGMSDSEINEALDYLRKKARVRYYK